MLILLSRLNKRCLAVCCAAAIVVLVAGRASSQTQTQHFQFKANTGENYSILVRSATLNGKNLSVGDEIGVFTPAGLCVGAIVVTQQNNLGLAAWQDDPQTPEVDGYIDGQSMYFHFWHASTKIELGATANYRLGNGTFSYGPYSDVELSASFNFAPRILPPDTIRFDEDTRFELLLDTIAGDANDSDSLLTWQVSGGKNLTAVITSKRILQLTPAPNWFGSETLTLVVTDPAGANDTAQLHILVKPVQDQPSVAVPLEPIGGLIIRSLNPILRWRAATDVDGDKLHYTVIYGTSPILAAPKDSIKTDLTEVRIPVFLKAGTRYYWQVKVTDGVTKPVSSSIENFVVADNAVAVNGPEVLPTSFWVEQNFPNPFSLNGDFPTTSIRYALPQPAAISIRIYNALGQRVCELFQGDQSAGFHQLVWDGRNDLGQHVSSGLYWLRLESANFAATKKILIVP
ncbi:MAG: Ig-like domain-containing protein [candidate division KSB1 bacterium]|nr:Ig-like domain-containing protein [candidate division KSB1 bacterium]MDZ7305270.1 Ig-like domain-containing protein [candidate division KSB1 bacterium]MDZ7313830.1 Ig-like domain-containing protein [candidate division KSB1 bacterium]